MEFKDLMSKLKLNQLKPSQLFGFKEFPYHLIWVLIHMEYSLKLIQNKKIRRNYLK